VRRHPTSFTGANPPLLVRLQTFHHYDPSF
jgi:hypothetical protein